MINWIELKHEKPKPYTRIIIYNADSDWILLGEVHNDDGLIVDGNIAKIDRTVTFCSFGPKCQNFDLKEFTHWSYVNKPKE